VSPENASIVALSDTIGAFFGLSWGMVTIRDAHDDDVEAITALYDRYIATRTIEWTERHHTVAGRRTWLADKRRGGWPVLVAEVGAEEARADGVRSDASDVGSDADDGHTDREAHTRRVVGVATYGDFRDSVQREGYRFTVEHTVHVDERTRGLGVGRALMEALVARAQAAGLHAMIGAVDGENHESIAFHERLGFAEVGRLPEVGRKFDRWLDLVLMQRTL